MDISKIISEQVKKHVEECLQTEVSKVIEKQIKDGKLIRTTTPKKIQLKMVTDKIKPKIEIKSNTLENKLRESGLAEGSIPKYLSTVKRISRNVFQKETFDYMDYLTGDNYVKVIEFIKTLEQTSIRPTIYILTVVLKLCGDMSNNLKYKKYEEFYQLTPSNQRFVRAKKAIRITMFDIEKKQREYEQEVTKMIKSGNINFDYYKRFIALSVYTLMPPLRPSEWLTSRLVALPKSMNYEEYTEIIPNYIDLNSGKMVVSKYKTCKKYGIRILQLPPKLLNIIREWSQVRHRDYLFESKKRKTGEYEPMVHNAFSNMFKNIQFDNGQIVPMKIRKLYISSAVIDGELIGSERERIARIMGHSVGTQYLVYSQYSQMLWGIDPTNPEDSGDEEYDDN